MILKIPKFWNSIRESLKGIEVATTNLKKHRLILVEYINHVFSNRSLRPLSLMEFKNFGIFRIMRISTWETGVWSYRKWKTFDQTVWFRPEVKKIFWKAFIERASFRDSNDSDKNFLQPWDFDFDIEFRHQDFLLGIRLEVLWLGLVMCGTYRSMDSWFR